MVRQHGKRATDGRRCLQTPEYILIEFPATLIERTRCLFFGPIGELLVAANDAPNKESKSRFRRNVDDDHHRDLTGEKHERVIPRISESIGKKKGQEKMVNPHNRNDNEQIPSLLGMKKKQQPDSIPRREPKKHNSPPLS